MKLFSHSIACGLKENSINYSYYNIIYISNLRSIFMVKYICKPRDDEYTYFFYTFIPYCCL